MQTYGITVSADRTSSCIRSLTVDPVQKTATVAFHNNDEVYKYSNVPTLECLRVAYQEDVSLGKWFHRVLNQPEIRFTKTSFGY
tara:strand:- start:214 stop:465 length:252 start_codon:yes stop_codon:yes gene_type:complete